MHSCMLYKTILSSPSALLSGMDHFYNEFEVSFELISCKDFPVRITKDYACCECSHFRGWHMGELRCLQGRRQKSEKGGAVNLAHKVRRKFFAG